MKLRPLRAAISLAYFAIRFLKRPHRQEPAAPRRLDRARQPTNRHARLRWSAVASRLRIASSPRRRLIHTAALNGCSSDYYRYRTQHRRAASAYARPKAAPDRRAQRGKRQRAARHARRLLARVAWKGPALPAVPKGPSAKARAWNGHPGSAKAESPRRPMQLLGQNSFLVSGSIC